MKRKKVPKVNINIRMNKAVRDEFRRFCAKTGMSMTTAFCIFARRTVSEQKIPFEIKTDDEYWEDEEYDDFYG